MKSEKITRREASMLLASFAGTAMLPWSVSAQEKSALNSWRVGRSVGGVKPIADLKLAEIKAVGMQCIEISINAATVAKMEHAAWLDWFKDLKKNADENGIEVRSVHIPFGKIWDVSDLDEKIRKIAIEKCAKYFDLVDILGSKIYILHPSYEPIKNEDRAKRIEKCIESLKELAPLAKEKGVRIALENLPRTCLGNTSKEMNHILDAVNVSEGLQICFDSNHTLQEKPEEFVTACGKRIITVHISDFDGIDEKHWLPYEGVINWKAVMNELIKAGYQGPFVFETSRFKDRPASNKDIFESWLRVKKDWETNG